jgi:hypothetical protein
MSQAANTLVKPLEVEDVFSTYLYTGTGAAQTITNGIDLDGEGGLVWTKSRSMSSAGYHQLIDTVRGVGKFLSSDLTQQEYTDTQTISAFNSTGYAIGNDAQVNTNNETFASWTFRKAPKFFDVATWTGDGTSSRAISHNLGTTVGMIIVKRTDGSEGWNSFHRSLGPTKSLSLHATTAQEDYDGYWNDTSPTNSVFTVGIQNNTSGREYVAYLFAHNDGDGEFGADGDADIIKCGSYTGNGSTDGVTVDLGFEPQWLMFKDTTNTNDWIIVDNIRGMVVDNDLANADAYLRPNLSNQEGASTIVEPTSTGFKVQNNGWTDTSGANIIYIAIRRGTKVPESATEVFAIDNQTASSAPFLTSNFPVDMAIRKTTTGGNSEVMSRLTQGKALFANATSSEQTDSVAQFDFNDGCLDNTGTDAARYGWMWKRAPGYFDVVAYTGNSTAGRTVSHNLGVVPEMMWVKQRPYSSNWRVYHSALGNVKALTLNDNSAAYNLTSAWNSTTPTATEFTLGTSNDVNENPLGHIAYLFASLPGISKVGSYTGNGSSQTIDCGFTSGARFVIVRDTTGGNWFVFDTDRGLTSSSSEALRLNLTSAEVSLSDAISPNSSGFIVEASYFNNSGDTYIFYAIA